MPYSRKAVGDPPPSGVGPVLAAIAVIVVAAVLFVLIF